MSEIEKLLIEKKQDIIQFAEGLDIKDINEVEKLIIHHYNQLPSSRIFTPERKFDRALAFVAGDLAPQDGREKIEIAILGYNKPKDWNQADREEILQSWQKGVVSQQKLIEEWKVMRIKTREGYKAVSEIEELIKDDNGVPQVVKGKIITDDELPIPRDYKQVNGTGDNTWPNGHYGYPLGTKWAMNIYGLTFDGEKDIKVEGNIYSNYDGDWADPNSEDFLMRKAPEFNFYDANVIVDEEKSTEDTLYISSLSAIIPKQVMITEDQIIVNEDGSTQEKEVEKPLEFIEYIYGVMEGTEIVDEDGNEYIHAPIRDFKAYLAEEDPKLREFYQKSYFMVDSKDFSEFHNLFARKDENGNIVRSKKNDSNYSVWEAIGLGVFVCKQVKPTKNGNDQLVLVGSGGKKFNAFMAPEHPKLDPIEEKHSAECLMTFNTVRKGTRYVKEPGDKKGKNVKDLINGDVQINNVLGFKKTFELVD